MRSCCSTLSEASSKPEQLSRMVESFKALANSTRLRLLLRLLYAESNVTTLCDELFLSQPVVSGHLAHLRQVGFVVRKRSGTQAIYSVRDPLLSQLIIETAVRTMAKPAISRREL